MSLHSVKGQKFNRWISARIDANSHTQIQKDQPSPEGEEEDGPTLSQSLANSPPITGRPPFVNGSRWRVRTVGRKEIVKRFSFAFQCLAGDEDACSGWSAGVDPEVLRVFECVIQASRGKLAMKLKKILRKAKKADDKKDEEKESLKQVALRKSGSKVPDDAPSCVNPAEDDPGTWACECMDETIDYCGGTNEECFVRVMCDNSNICQSWKTTNCADSNEARSSLIASALQQRTGVGSERAQANVSDSDVDSGLTGAAEAQRTQVSTRSLSSGSLDGAMQGKCSQ